MKAMQNNQEKITVDYTDDYPRWKDEYKSTYKILIPDMLPWHFAIIEQLLKMEGYDVEILKNDSRAVIDEGLKHVHNDTCYPCLCVVGQYIDALKSGKYDVKHTAVMISQSGGGCRASNYVALIRKALKAQFPDVPVVSLNFSGLERDSSFKIGLKLLLKLAFGIFYGDSIMWCYNQTKPYEEQPGAADIARDAAMNTVIESYRSGSYFRYKKINSQIISTFAAVRRSDVKKVKVGVVGEIYVKYSYLGNNHLEQFLLDEDADCGEFWNSIILDVMDKVDSGEEKELTARIPMVPVDPSLRSFGAELSRRSQWICEHSDVFSSNLLNFDGDLHYDHSDARYVYLSRCHDDAGTVTVFGIIS